MPGQHRWNASIGACLVFPKGVVPVGPECCLLSGLSECVLGAWGLVFFGMADQMLELK